MSPAILLILPIPFNAVNDHGTVYYAYPPTQDKPAREARSALFDLIDLKFQLMDQKRNLVQTLVLNIPQQLIDEMLRQL
jgi:hypothetical protein